MTPVRCHPRLPAPGPRPARAALSGSGPSRKVVHAMRSFVRPSRGLARVAPLPRETTASFVARLAARNHVSEAVLFDHVGIPRPGVTDTRSKGANVFYEVEELYFNAPARRAIAWVAGVPEEHLRRALPQWEPGLASRGATGRPVPDIGCRGCRRWGDARGVWLGVRVVWGRCVSTSGIINWSVWNTGCGCCIVTLSRVRTSRSCVSICPGCPRSSRLVVGICVFCGATTVTAFTRSAVRCR